ncbi:translin-associated protein x [Lichtheimia corymbifera JMRC:FSU:9682]|uniref:Translin-associated protein x n=1 Tax=Lichtheimia corymbifera JMRC:FSU:9682 TaxID=1263082 RepID=A0A068S0I5_9FUNG|nr:translin-associated protein x [Lichtheimia corymbifera JMRC:FSU:9682]
MDIEQFFKNCRNVLDAHHDRRERIIKLSRDITAQSKKMIFALHRAIQRGTDYKEAKSKQDEIMGLFRQLAPEVEGPNYERYARSFAGAFEEFIEGIAFFHYLEKGTLITKEEVDNYFKDEEGKQWIEVRAQDYVLGLADFTGELMRYAISAVTSGNYKHAMDICTLLRNISTDCEMLAGSSLPILNKKMGAMRASVGKVERACYAFQIRGSEYPKEMYQSIIRDQQARFEEGRRGEDDA